MPVPHASASLVPSPCVNVCRMNAQTGFCEGCFRSVDEIAAWSSMSDLQKRAVWKLLPARRAQSAPSATRP
jgi:predicted Fe-S protein YdhL (DUF1289 family)